MLKWLVPSLHLVFGGQEAELEAMVALVEMWDRTLSVDARLQTVHPVNTIYGFLEVDWWLWIWKFCRFQLIYHDIWRSQTLFLHLED